MFCDVAPSFRHVGIVVEDIESEIEFLSPPLDSPDGKTRLLFCRGKENNFIELVTIKANKQK